MGRTIRDTRDIESWHAECDVLVIGLGAAGAAAALEAAASGADTLLAGDLGCLLNMAGKLARRGSNVRVRHVAEVLAHAAEGPAIGESEAK